MFKLLTTVLGGCLCSGNWVTVQRPQALLVQRLLVPCRHTGSSCASRSSLPCMMACSPHLLNARAAHHALQQNKRPPH